ncbi:MAG: ribosome maturation factor RimM [Chryseolinea sp.]
MVSDSHFKIGFVQKTHGLKGEVTLVLDNSAPADVSALKMLYLGDEDRIVPYFIAAISPRGSKTFVRFEDVNTIEEAAQLVRKSIFLEKSTRPKKGRGEFYDDEIVGFQVDDAAIGRLGKVTGVAMAGSNRLLAVDYAGKEVLIPINSPFITSINKAKKLVSVELPDGFLDI